GLCDEVVAGLAVVAARGSHHETGDARLLGNLGEAHAGVMIYAVAYIGIEVAERIVGESGEMNDRFDASKIASLEVTHVLRNGGHIDEGAAGGEGAARLKITITANDAVPRFQEHGRRDAADVAAMTGQI